MRNRRAVVQGTVLFAIVSVLSVATFLAVHDDTLFQLGDSLGTPGSATIVGSTARPECDWADLFDADPTQEEIDATVEACGGIDGSFVADGLATGGSKDDTTFAKGSSKNDAPIASWRWATGNVPAKDDLSNVYSYATLNDSGELILFAGLERLAGSGDSHVDFEFNQSEVGLDKQPPCGNDRTDGNADGGPCEFTGERAVDDLLVVMDFERGGDLGYVEVRRWDGAAWILADTVGGEGCNLDDTVCAFNNGGVIDGGPWDNYDDHGNVVGTIERNGFTEAGINISSLLGSTPCFTTVQTKTRSSSSLSSSLKDFVLSSFDICSIEVTKEGFGPSEEPLSKIGDDTRYEFSIENTGGAELSLDSMIDSSLGDITPEAQAAGCNPLAAASSCSFSIVQSVPDESEDPFVTSVFAEYRGSGQTTVSGISDGDDLEINLFQPAVDVTVTGDPISTAGNTALYSVTIENQSSSDSPDLANGTVTSAVLGDLLDPANPFVTSSDCTSVLPTGATCTIQAARLVLASDPDPLIVTVDATYNPAGGFPNVISDNGSHSIDLVHPGFSLTLVISPGSGFVGDTITYTYALLNTGDVPLEQISVVDSLLGDVSAAFPQYLEPGSATVIVVLTRTIQAGDPNPVVNQSTATYQVLGLPNQIVVTGGATVQVLIPCALSPGFWKGGEGQPKWNDLLSDPIAQTAGFDHDTPFPWLDGSAAGLGYLDILESSALGDVTRQLGFKYVAARLNQAAFGVPADTASLLNSIDVYFASNPFGSDPRGRAKQEGEGLLGALNGYFTAIGHDQCPPPDEF